MGASARKHEIVMTFDLQSVHTTELIAYIALAIILLSIIAAPFFTYKRNKG